MSPRGHPHPVTVTERDGVRWGDLYLEGGLPYEPQPDTYWHVWYQREYERGYEAVEDLHSPGLSGSCTRFHGYIPVDRGTYLPRRPLPGHSCRKQPSTGWNGHHLHSAMGMRSLPGITGSVNPGGGILLSVYRFAHRTRAQK